MSAEDNTIKPIRGEKQGRTLAFQLKHGFRVLAVVSNYRPGDPENLGYVAVIEWINEQVATLSDYGPRNQKSDPVLPL